MLARFATPCILALLTYAAVAQTAPASPASAPDRPPQAPAAAPATISPEERAARIKARQEQMANDWANLKRYRDANLAITTPPQVVFMGDSITELWAKSPAVFFPGKPYLGRGIGGQTTPQMVLRFQQDVVDLKPSVVVINGGTNDIAGNTGPSTLKMIEHNLKSMTQIAQSNAIRVVLTSVTPAVDYPWRKGLAPAEKIVELNAWMRTFCQNNHCVYADYFSALTDEKHGMREGLSVDGVHPTEAGYRLMSPVAQQAILQAMQP
jgi:lysophospholipase L1-like esterase